MQALIKITKANYNFENSMNATTNAPLEKHNYFGDYTTTFQQTTLQYENSIEKTIELRRDYIACLKSQMELLNKVKVRVCLCVGVCVFVISIVTQIHFKRILMNKEERR